jgi:glycosyltransferase involved in cell wall biosynthesis
MGTASSIGVYTAEMDWRWIAELFGGRSAGVVPPQTIYGRWVYASEFLEAALRHGRSRYHLLISCMQPQRLERVAADCARATDGRMAVHGPLELPALLRSGELDVLHDPWGESHRLVFARNRFAERPVPITGVVHGIGNVLTPFKDLVKVFSGCLPADSLVTPSAACAEAIDRRLRILRDRLMQLGLSDELALPRTAVVPLGIDAGELAPLDRAACREELGWPAAPAVALYLGRFSTWNKADLLPLLRAFALARRRCGSELELVLAGDDRDTGYRGLLLDLAARHGLDEGVRVLDEPIAPRGRDKRVLLSAADFFVSPSDNGQETFGLTLLEAMAAGLPVLASDMGGYRDLVRHEREGLVVPTSWCGISRGLDAISPLTTTAEDCFYFTQGVSIDVDGLADGLARLGGDAGLRHELGAAALQRAEGFDWRYVIARYEDFWDELVALARSPEQLGAAQALRGWAERMPFDIGRQELIEPFISDGLVRDACVETTESGRDVLDGLAPLGPVYPELRELVRPDAVGTILRRAVRPVPVRDLAGGDLAPSGALALLVPDDFLPAWLLKNGYLRRVPSAAPS